MSLVVAYLIIIFRGFIALETLVTDDTGLLSTRTRSVKGKRKGKSGRNTRKEIQKAKYSFVKSSKKTRAYSDYFNPDVDVERRMMGLSAAVNTLFLALIPPLTIR